MILEKEIQKWIQSKNPYEDMLLREGYVQAKKEIIELLEKYRKEKEVMW